MKDKLKVDDLICKIANIIQHKTEKYRKLLKLTKQQKTIIENNRWEDLNQVIDNKEQIIKKINHLDNQIKLYRKILAQRLGFELNKNFLSNLLKQELSCTEKLREVVKDSYQIMTEIKEIEESNQQKVINKKKELEKQMKEVSTGLNVNRAYSGQYNNYEGRFIDHTE